MHRVRRLLSELFVLFAPYIAHRERREQVDRKRTSSAKKQTILSSSKNPFPDPARAVSASRRRALFLDFFARRWRELGRARNSRAFAIVTGRIRVAITSTDVDEALARGLRAWAARAGGSIPADNCGRIVVVVDECDPENEQYVLTDKAMDIAEPKRCASDA